MPGARGPPLRRDARRRRGCSSLRRGSKEHLAWNGKKIVATPMPRFTPLRSMIGDFRIVDLANNQLLPIPTKPISVEDLARSAVDPLLPTSDGARDGRRADRRLKKTYGTWS